jgi:putative ABC transport system permease protein
MLKIRLRQGSLFLILGFVVGILVLSFGISYVNGMRYKGMDASVNKRDQESFWISYKKLSDISNLMEDLQEEVDINISNKLWERERKIEIIGTYFINEPLYNLNVKGRFISNIECKSNKNIVVIDEKLSSMCYERENKRYINIDRMELEVVGEFKGSKDTNKRIYIPFDLFLEKYKDKATSDFSFIVFKTNINKEEIKNIIQNFIGEHGILVFNEDSFKLSDSILFYYSVIILLVCCINIINFSCFWIRDRKREISLRKTVGAQNMHIWFLVFKDVLSITLIALIISILIQSIFTYAINRVEFLNLPISLSIDNLLYSSLFCVLLAFISTIPSYLIAIKTQPAVVLKGE